MIVHCFISRNDDWILRHHLEVYGRIADRMVCVLDRSPQSLPILEEYGCDVIEWHGPDTPRYNENGLLLPDEGAMRQAAWDGAMKYFPELVLLGDTDETPTAEIGPWLRDGLDGPDPAVDCWYADWVHLWGDAHHAIGGDSEWSFQNPRANKKGIVVRPRPGRVYRYRSAQQHVRMEPSPLSEIRAVLDKAHRMAPCRLLHWKYADLDRWRADPMSREPRFAELLKPREIVLL